MRYWLLAVFMFCVGAVGFKFVESSEHDWPSYVVLAVTLLTLCWIFGVGFIEVMRSAS